MSVNKSNQERRRSPRLFKSIPIKLCQESGDIVTQSVNISHSGMYCRIDKYIEPMTRLKIHLLIPIKKSGKNSTKKVSCQGAVVRTEQIPGTEEYNLAIFFNEIAQRDAELISEYISSSMEQDHEKKK